MKIGSVTFRRASTGDLAIIVALLADDPIGRGRENLGPQLDNGYREAFAAIERDLNQLLAVAERSGDIIGVLQLSFIPGLTRRGMWRGQIEGVRVAAEARGIALLLPGHYATERCGIEELAVTLQQRVPDIEVWASRTERDPLGAV